MDNQEKTAQQEFDETYITSTEITERLSIHRCTLILARKRGQLPDPILVNDQIFVWRRKDVEANLTQWEQSLKARRG